MERDVEDSVRYLSACAVMGFLCQLLRMYKDFSHEGLEIIGSDKNASG